MWAWNAASLRIFSFVLGLDESDVLELSSIHLFSHESNFYHKFSFHAEFSESWVPRLRIPMVEEMLHLSHNFYLVDRDPLVSPSNLELNREYKGWSLKYEAHFFLQNLLFAEKLCQLCEKSIFWPKINYQAPSDEQNLQQSPLQRKNREQNRTELYDMAYLLFFFRENSQIKSK